MVEQKSSAKAPAIAEKATIEMAPWLAERRVRDVSDDDDDFLLEDFFDDDYEYRRRQARRPDLSERQLFDFWD